MSHLFFVDDSFIFFFCNAYIMEINEVKDILDDYSIISGQMANFDKSAAYFSKGAFQFRCRNVSSMLGL